MLVDSDISVLDRGPVSMVDGAGVDAGISWEDRHN
jgi:hypothetical protein